MSRVIKFRAWDIKEKLMCDVYSITFLAGGIKISAPGYPIGDETEVWAKVNDEYKDRLEQKAILMQFTGLKDKNGKEIYEGDIIKFAAYKSNPDGEHRIGVLVYSKGGYFFEYKQNNIIANFVYGIEKSRLPQCYIEWAVDHDGICEILGNIYENPELLKNS